MDFSTVTQEVEAKRQNAWRGYLFSGLMGLAILAMLFLGKIGAAAVITVPWALYHFFLVLPDGKKFGDAFLRGSLQAGLSSQLDEVAYHGKTGIPREALLEARLLPILDGRSCMTFHRVTGVSQGMAVEISDVSFQLEGPDGKGRPQFLSGCWVRVNLGRPTGRDLRLVTDNLLPPQYLSPWYRETMGLVLTEAENPRLGKTFSLWQQEGAPGLSDSAAEHLAELREAHDLPLAVGLAGDRLTFFLPRRFIAPGAPSIRRPVPEAALRRSPLPELDGILETALALRRMDTADTEPPRS